MLLAFSHLQKDDSLVPLLPYATGCFLASILLTISGIAETHPHALALATYLIQFAWLLLQIQGVMLVYMFGSQGQGRTLFRVWLVAIQLLDVHRRFLGSYLGAAAGVPEGGGSGNGHGGLNGTIVGSIRSGQGQGATFGKLSPAEGGVSPLVGQQHPHLQQHLEENGEAMLQDVMASVWGYYSGMLCNTAPSVCDVISTASSSSYTLSSFLSTLGQSAASFIAYSQSTGAHSKVTPSPSTPKATGAGHGGEGGGMKEMENLVVFEVVAGLGVSGLMCLIWAAMAIRRGGIVAIPGVHRTRARVQRWGKAIKAMRDEWRGVVVSRVDARVEQHVES